MTIVYGTTSDLHSRLGPIHELRTLIGARVDLVATVSSMTLHALLLCLGIRTFRTPLRWS